MSASTLINPILRGFNPDASITRVGADYYIATSTFEWLPGVDIYHSTDLVNWEFAAAPLEDRVNVDLRGNEDSASIWAPNLSYAQGRFWLVFTDVKSRGPMRDMLNYVISAPDIRGPWTEPVFINASGFDPALFHDGQRHYFLNMLYDHRPEKPSFAGLVMQEIDLATLELTGDRRHFFTGTDLGVCEGPTLMKRDGYYYLLAAAGGTGYSHAATVCRSENVWGPYQVSPFHPLLTTKDDPDNPVQKAGHASFVQAGDEWFIVHIMARPLTLQRGRCPLGRETGLQKIEWVDGWPRLANGTHSPDLVVAAPKIARGVEQLTDHSERIDFADGVLPRSLKTLRHSPGDELSFQARPGHLRIRGAQSLGSLHDQALLARRWQSTSFRVETEVEFAPKSFQQIAGLICYYDTRNWQYLQISFDEQIASAVLRLEVCDGGVVSLVAEQPLADPQAPVRLAVRVEGDRAQFEAAQDDAGFRPVGTPTAADRLSDDYVKELGGLSFTGAFVGICVQDLDDHTAFADFRYFDYRENPGGGE